MDIGAVATGLTNVLAPALPFLLGLGGKMAERAGRDLQQRLGDKAGSMLQRLWDRLWPEAKKDPATRDAVEQAALDPEDERRLLALAIRLQRVLEERPELADEARRLVIDASSYQAAHGGVAARHISGSNVITGSENVVQQGRTNINFGTARDVTISKEEEDAEG